MVSDSADGTATVISSLQAWAKQPFSTEMDLTHWGLFTGLVIVLAIIWLMILHELKGEF